MHFLMRDSIIFYNSIFLSKEAKFEKEANSSQSFSLSGSKFYLLKYLQAECYLSME
jgi:hypothetical protein